jgi:hypothetical protein
MVMLPRSGDAVVKKNEKIKVDLGDVERVAAIPSRWPRQLSHS